MYIGDRYHCALFISDIAFFVVLQKTKNKGKVKQFIEIRCISLEVICQGIAMRSKKYKTNLNYGRCPGGNKTGCGAS